MIIQLLKASQNIANADRIFHIYVRNHHAGKILFNDKTDIPRCLYSKLLRCSLVRFIVRELLLRLPIYGFFYNNKL